MGACLAGPTQFIPCHPSSPGTSRPRSPSRKSSSYLMTLSCRGALHESPMLVSDLASARKFMGWPGTRGEAHTRDGQGGGKSVSSQGTSPLKGAPTASEASDTVACLAQDASGLFQLLSHFVCLWVAIPWNHLSLSNLCRERANGIAGGWAFILTNSFLLMRFHCVSQASFKLTPIACLCPLPQ